MNQLVDGVVTINGENIGVVPNSVKMKLGSGESKLLPVSSGNGQIETVFAENMENKMSKFSFETRVTSDNIDLLKSWKKNKKENAITFQEDTTNLTFTNMAQTNDPEITISAEGKIEFVFEGDPAR